jgi:L-amino acid N-acyltransferase YncA
MPLSKHGYPRPLILKNSQEVWLRPLDPAEDEQPLFEFLEGLSEDDRWYLEFDAADQTAVRRDFLEFDPACNLPILASGTGGEVLGLANLQRYQSGARGHIGRLRVVVAPGSRGMRLGTYLLLDLIQLAVDLGLRVLVAQFVRGIEDQAIRAARRLDFFEQAVVPDYAKDKRGNSYDLVIMVKRIHRGYDDF